MMRWRSTRRRRRMMVYTRDLTDPKREQDRGWAESQTKRLSETQIRTKTDSRRATQRNRTRHMKDLRAYMHTAHTYLNCNPQTRKKKRKRARNNITRRTEILTKYWQEDKDAWQNDFDCQRCACTGHKAELYENTVSKPDPNPGKTTLAPQEQASPITPHSAG